MLGTPNCSAKSTALLCVKAAALAPDTLIYVLKEVYNSYLSCLRAYEQHLSGYEATKGTMILRCFTPSALTPATVSVIKIEENSVIVARKLLWGSARLLPRYRMLYEIAARLHNNPLMLWQGSILEVTTTQTKPDWQRSASLHNLRELAGLQVVRRTVW